MRTVGKIAAGVAFLSPVLAHASDLNALVRLLEPAFYTMNVASVCLAAPGWSAGQPLGPRGSAHDYGFHVKAEIMDGLNGNEVTWVLRRAADDARARIKMEMMLSVNGQSREMEKIRLEQWCARVGTPHISRYIEEHEREHGEFYEQIIQAKRVSPI